MSVDDFNDIFRILTGRKPGTWAKTTMLRITVKQNVLNGLHYENTPIDETEGPKFEAWMAVSETSFKPGPSGNINDKENKTIRINTKEYPFAKEFTIGDILLELSTGKRWLINTKNDTSEYTNTIRFNAVEDF